MDLLFVCSQRRGSIPRTSQARQACYLNDSETFLVIWWYLPSSGQLFHSWGALRHNTEIDVGAGEFLPTTCDLSPKHKTANGDVPWVWGSDMNNWNHNINAVIASGLLCDSRSAPSQWPFSCSYVDSVLWTPGVSKDWWSKNAFSEG